MEGRGGGPSLGPKSKETLGAKGTKENFFLGSTGTRVGGNRHLVTPAPPCAMGGAGLSSRGGGDYKGHIFLHFFAHLHHIHSLLGGSVRRAQGIFLLFSIPTLWNPSEGGPGLVYHPHRRSGMQGE